MRTAALAALLAVGLDACREAAPPGGITVLLESAPDSLDDRLALSAVGQRIAQLISPGLVTFDDASMPQPDLGESFAFVVATTLDFALREGLAFHDGTPLTARDVKATYDAL